ncbi:hypothetical protein [Kitasatospora sp. NPDC088779]|uniref:hypothetical protein n=1 Tax=Kitasatospora sp. NPDC088779 TaxID=3154964 RepID=UPI00341A873B
MTSPRPAPDGPPARTALPRRVPGRHLTGPAPLSSPATALFTPRVAPAPDPLARLTGSQNAAARIASHLRRGNGSA